MKTTFKRIVAFMLSMLMTFSLFSTALVVYAVDTSKPLVYVSIGDSMTNGYGMEGYDGNSGIANYANDSYANKFAAYLAGYTGPIANDQVIFVGTKGVVDHRQLAMSGYRSEDLHWTLELDYQNEALIQKLWDNQYSGNKWNDVRVKWFGEMGFATGDYRTWNDLVNSTYRYADGAAKILNIYNNVPSNSVYFSSSYANADMLQKVAAGIAADPYFPQSGDDKLVMGPAYMQIATEFYQESIKDADVISLALGNTNFGTHMLGQMTDAIGGDVTKFANRYDIENVYDVMDFDAETEAKVRSFVAESSAMVEDMLGALAGGDPELAAALENIVMYCIISYLANYIGSVNAILTLNEKDSVDIIQISLMNAYANEGESDPKVVTLGDVVQKLYTPINMFIAALPTLMKATGNELYEKANFYYADAETVESMVLVYGDDFYKDKTTGQYVDYPDWNFDSATMVANANSIVRERFIEEGDGIVKGAAFSALAGAVKSSYGIDLRRDLTVEEVVAYEAMTDAEKAAFAVADPATAMSIAFYFAFEHSTIKAGTGTVTLESLAASGDVSVAFGEVMAVFGNNIAAAAAPYAPYAASALANAFNAGVAALGFSVTPDQILAIYAGAATAEDVAAAVPEAYRATVVENLKSVVGNVSNICIMLALPRTLSDAMTGNEEKGIARNDTVCGLLCLNARLLIGTGIGGHPSPNGHNNIFESMKNAFETGYTSEDKTGENLIFIVTEYGDEIFALVDGLAVKKADYNLKKNSSFVAFGDNKEAADRFASYLDTSLDLPAAGFDYKTDTTLTVDGSRITLLRDAIAADPSIVAGADLISIAYSYDKITEDTLNILFDLLAEGESTLEVPLPWETLSSPEITAEIRKYVATMKADLDAQGLGVKVGEIHAMAGQICTSDLTVSESAARAIEYFAYFAAEYLLVMPEVVALIRQINPDAIIMVNAVSNPVSGAGVRIMDTQLMFGEYLDMIIDAVYLRTALLTLTNENVVMVPTTEVETTYTGRIIGEDGILEILEILLGKTNIEINPTDAGKEYIYNVTKNSLNAGLLRGDLNFDGKVTVADSVYLMQSISNPAKWTLNQKADFNGDGSVNSKDVTYLLRHILSPAKYPLK